ncbi:MAG: hypothetical protein JRH20_10145 [Deltaproteobacteria bacterium]|nr:hypothetical protein [Deltaproteobacteria bacterium]
MSSTTLTTWRLGGITDPRCDVLSRLNNYRGIAHLGLWLRIHRRRIWLLRPQRLKRLLSRATGI